MQMRSGHTSGLLGLLLAVLCLAVPVAAQDAPPGWRGRIGGGVLVAPTFSGSRVTGVQPLIDADLTYGDRVFLDTDDGLGVYFFRGNGLSIGASAFYRHGRASNDLPARLRLAGVGGISDAAQARLVALYETGIGSLGASLVQDLGGVGGTTLELRANTVIPVIENLFYLAPEVGAVLADGRHMQGWYGVPGFPAPLPGIRPYRPEAGVESVYAQLGGGLRLSERVGLIFRGELRYLTDGAGRSPIVDSRLQPSIGIGLSYMLN